MFLSVSVDLMVRECPWSTCAFLALVTEQAADWIGVSTNHKHKPTYLIAGELNGDP